MSHLIKFGFKPVNDDNISIAFSNSLTEVKFFKENVEPSACMCVCMYVFICHE